MQLTSILACVEKRASVAGQPDSFQNDYVVGLQLAFGAYDSAGQITSSQELFTHGKVTGNNCNIVKFGPKDYLNALTIKVDFFSPSINQLQLIKRSTEPDAGVVFLNIGSTRPFSDRSVSTSLTNLE